VIDNMSAPLSEAACGVITPSAVDTADGSGVNVTLNYSAWSGAPTQRTAGNPIYPVDGHGLSIVLGDPRIVTREAAAGLARGAGTIIISSSKGAGSPKNAGF
jgi:hypothetical protein